MGDSFIIIFILLLIMAFIATIGIMLILDGEEGE